MIFFGFLLITGQNGADCQILHLSKSYRKKLYCLSLFKLRHIAMGWCWPLRCKLRSLSPQRREDRGVSGETFLPAGSRPGLAPGCSANSFAPLSETPPLPRPPQTTGCQSAWLVQAKQAPVTGPKGQQRGCQMGQHFTAEHHSPNKQCVGPGAHKATWNLSLAAVHGWFTPQNQAKAQMCIALDSKFLSQ